jgi:O-antigen ligase
MSHFPLESAWPLDTYQPNQRAARALTWGSIVHFIALVPLVVAFFPLAPSETLDSGLNASRIMELGLLAIGCATITTMALMYPAWRIKLDRTGLTIMGLFCAWAFLSAAWSPGPLLAAGKAFEMTAVTVVAAMMGSWASVYLPRRNQVGTILALALVAAVLVLLGLNVILHGTPIPMTEDKGRVRMFLGFAHPLVSADLLSLGIIAVIACPMHMLFKAPLLLFLAGPWLLTQPRGAAVGVASAIAIMSIFRIRRTDKRIIALGMLVLSLVAIALALGPHLMRLFDDLLPEDAATLNGRSDLWEYVIYLIRRRPLTGYGYYSSRFLLLDLFPWAGHCHNAYLETAVSTGVPGVILLAALTVHIARVALRTQNMLLLGVASYCYCVSMLDPLLLTWAVPMLVLLVSLMTAGAKQSVPLPAIQTTRA